MLKYIQELDFKSNDLSIIKNKKFFNSSPLQSQNTMSLANLISPKELNKLSLPLICETTKTQSKQTGQQLLKSLLKQSRTENITRNSSLHGLTQIKDQSFHSVVESKQKKKLKNIINQKNYLDNQKDLQIKFHKNLKFQTLQEQEQEIQEKQNQNYILKPFKVDLLRNHHQIKMIEEACATSLVQSIRKEDFNQVSHSSYLKVSHIQEKFVNELEMKKVAYNQHLYKCSVLASLIIFNKLFTLNEFIQQYIKDNNLEAMIFQPDTLFEHLIELYDVVKKIFKSKRKIVNIIIKTPGFNRKLVQIFFKKMRDLPENVPVEIYFDNQIEFELYFHLRKNVTKELLIVKFLLGFQINEIHADKMIQKIIFSGGNVFTNHEIYFRMRNRQNQTSKKTYQSRNTDVQSIIKDFVKEMKIDFDFLQKTYYFLINLEHVVKNQQVILLEKKLIKLDKHMPLMHGNTREERNIQIKEMIESDDNPNLKSLVNHIEESEKKLGRFELIKNDHRLQHIEINATEKLLKSAFNKY